MLMWRENTAKVIDMDPSNFLINNNTNTNNIALRLRKEKIKLDDNT